MNIFNYIKKVNETIKYYIEILYAKRRYKKTFKKTLLYKAPKTFNEKIQWLKVFEKNKEIIDLTDKYKVRNYVKEKVGKKFLNELIKIYDFPSDIDFKVLPKKFALKLNHGSGWNIICDDKDKISISESIRKLHDWFHYNYYKCGYEWNYQGIVPKILLESFIESPDGKDLIDYKIFCFNGNPKYIQIDVDRFSNHTRCFYNEKWSKQNFTVHYPLYKGKVSKPINFDKMLYIANKLSNGLKFVRVDLYNVNGRIIFGEMTFYPGNGFEKFYPNKYDNILGNYLSL